MSRLLFTAEFDEDLERLQRFLGSNHPEDAIGLIEIILDSLHVLTLSPEIGRPYRMPLRELVISRGKSGYLALYEYHPKADSVTVLRIRHQRESGYKSNK